MSFHEIQFPVDIAYGSSSGPERRTTITQLDSGFEHRTTNWSDSKRRYNVNYGVKTYDKLHAVLEFWEARLGPLYGFRYKDWADYKSVAPQQDVTHIDQIIGTADGVETDFQLIKNYTSGANTWVRDIRKPVAGTVKVSINDANQASGWTVDTTTGIITFASAPADTSVIKAGYEFDTPVRFEGDSLPMNLEAFKHGTMSDIILMEIRV